VQHRPVASHRFPGAGAASPGELRSGPGPRAGFGVGFMGVAQGCECPQGRDMELSCEQDHKCLRFPFRAFSLSVSYLHFSLLLPFIPAIRLGGVSPFWSCRKPSAALTVVPAFTRLPPTSPFARSWAASLTPSPSCALAGGRWDRTANAHGGQKDTGFDFPPRKWTAMISCF